MSGRPKLGPRKDPGENEVGHHIIKLSICDGSDEQEITCYMRRMNQMCNGIFPHSSGRVGKEKGGWGVAVDVATPTPTGIYFEG